MKLLNHVETCYLFFKPSCHPSGCGSRKRFALQDLDTPYLTDDNSYFPVAGTHGWVNSNTTNTRASCGAVPAPFPMADCEGLTLEEATIDQMQEWMSSGLLTSRQLVKCYLGRIYQLNEYVKYVEYCLVYFPLVTFTYCSLCS